jgi:hypothetical protein
MAKTKKRIYLVEVHVNDNNNKIELGETRRLTPDSRNVNKMRWRLTGNKKLADMMSTYGVSSGD